MQGQSNLIYMVMVFCVSVYGLLLEFFDILDEQLDVHIANGSLTVDLNACRVSAS